MAIDKIIKGKKVVDIIYDLVRKKLAIFNTKASGSGITRIPTDRQIKKEMENVFQTLRDGGLNPVSANKIIKSEEDLARVIAEIEQKKITDIKNRKDAAEGIQTVIDKLNKGIPLNPSDQMKIEGTGFETTLDAFKGFQPRVIQGGKGIESINLSKYTNEDLNKLAEEGNKLQLELAELDDTGGTKLPFREFQKKSNRLTEINKIIKAAQDSNLPDSFFENPKSLAEQLIELTNKNLKDRGLGGIKLGDDLPPPKKKKPAVDPKLQKSEDTKKMIKELEERNERALEDFVDDTGGTKEGAEFDEEPFDAAKGGIARIGFDKGSPPSKSRRNFLKLMGGLASLPIVGKLFKVAKPAAKVAKTVPGMESGVPAYFPKLVQKIKVLGDDVTKTEALQERQIVTRYKDYEMTEDLSSGAIQIEKTNIGIGNIGDETYEGIKSKELIEYAPEEVVIGKDGKPVKVPAQYEETTARSTGFDGKLEDFDDGLESVDEIIEEVETTDFEFLKKQPKGKASGGLAYMMGE